MKKVVIIFCILILLIGFSFSINATSIKDKAYDCLNKKIDDKTCSALSLKEKTFSVLATGKCKTELLGSKLPNNCWANTGTSCNLLETAQAITALHPQGENVNSSISWLLNQTKNSTGFDWFLQIDTSNTLAECTLTTENSQTPFTFIIKENEELSGSSNSLFEVEEYWIKIKLPCYDREFEVSCNESFSTTLLFQKTTAPIHILNVEKSASAGDSIIEKVNSKCFKKGTSCDYESTLWATLVLDLVEQDISSYLPYLIALADTQINQKFFPEAFLYYLTADEDYSASLKTKQKTKGYWQATGDKYYDSAVVLFPFSNSNNFNKTKTISWLEEEQGSDGCWNSGNIVDTSFLLYSIWPKLPVSQVEVLKCKDYAGYCMPSAACNKAEGNEMNYSCFGFNVCCSEPEKQENCSEIGGKICEADKVCSVSLQETSDTTKCCVGDCKEPGTEVSECEDHYGFCKVGCEKGEQEKLNYSCLETSEKCCMTKEKTNFLIYIILGILLILLIILFIFRKKLFKKKPVQVPTTQRRPEIPPRRMPPRRIPPQRRVPGMQQKSTPIKPVAKPVESKEDVLKKLKEMGK